MSMPMSSSYNNQSSMNMDDMAMHMSFFWGKDVVVLFSGWPGNGRLGTYLLAPTTVFVMAIGTEILSVAPRLKPSGVSPFAGAATHASLYAVRMTLAYSVMLSVMSFNVGIFLAMVVSHAVGLFVVKYTALAAVARTVDC